jgi:hypothetical protein
MRHSERGILVAGDLRVTSAAAAGSYRNGEMSAYLLHSFDILRRVPVFASPDLFGDGARAVDAERETGPLLCFTQSQDDSCRASFLQATICQ